MYGPPAPNCPQPHFRVRDLHALLGYTVLSWCSFSSTGVLNLMYLWTLLLIIMCACLLAFKWYTDCFSSFINSRITGINVAVSMRFGSNSVTYIFNNIWPRFVVDIFAWANNCSKFHQNSSRVRFWLIDMTWNDPLPELWGKRERVDQIYIYSPCPWLLHGILYMSMMPLMVTATPVCVCV